MSIKFNPLLSSTQIFYIIICITALAVAFTPFLSLNFYKIRLFKTEYLIKFLDSTNLAQISSEEA
jgi:hypothetical protein